MPVSLDTAVVATYRQMLPALNRLLDKAQERCAETSMPAEELTGLRLAPDMWPFAKQVEQAAHHSAGAIKGVRAGLFNPHPDPAPEDFDGLREIVARSVALVEAVEPGELDAIAGNDMRFEYGEMRMNFTVEDFLLSFSLPNFYFHVTTAYAILRNEGLDIGKRVYLGATRRKS